jgi:3-methylfumaryl-CoA hydratase
MIGGVASTERFALLAALLDHDVPPWPPGEMPPLGHWLLFPPTVRQSALGPDGHPARVDDGLPRRMWAGSRVRFLTPVPLDARVTQTVEEVARADKQGRTGPMRFVTLRKCFIVDGALAIEEEQDIVYRAAATPADVAAPPRVTDTAPALDTARTLMLDAPALFRFSALTFNAHRIHYDRDYAVAVEGYRGLVVHGPFLATLLMDHWLRAHPAARVSRFAFRALRPVFAGDSVTLGACDTRLIAVDDSGGLAMDASITL